MSSKTKKTVTIISLLIVLIFCIISILNLSIVKPVDAVTVSEVNNKDNVFSLCTKDFIMDDNTSYSSTSTELSTLLSPLDNSNQGEISNIISVDVRGQNVQKAEYNGVTAFRVPYSSKFYIDTAFDYANANYADWERNLAIGKMANSNGTILDWKISNDSYTFRTTSDNKDHAVGTGAVLIELSNDNKTWEKYRMFSYTSNNKTDVWQLSGEKVSSGIYVRISYLFEIYAHWVNHWQTYEREWYNYLLFGIPIGGHWVDHYEDLYEYKNIKEVSSTFFVGVDFFSDGPDFGVITVKNLSNKDDSEYECEGFTKEELKAAETLTDGGQTTTGFSIESLYPNTAYKIEIAKNGGQFSEVSSGYSTTSSGRYEIKATSRFGEQKSITVYICPEDVARAYFGVPFATNPNETALIQGTRLFAGSNDYIKSIGLSPTYNWAYVPVFVKGCSLNIKDTSNLASLTGSITYEGTAANGAIDIPLQNSSINIELQTPGYYTALLSTSNTDGDITYFRVNFWVVENEIGPEINKQIFTLLTHETYDLTPVYYSVDMPRGPYTYIDENGVAVEKQGVLRYAFSTYGAALDFSLRVQKEYAHRFEDGTFRYLNSSSPNVKLNEFELFEEMSQVAKTNVKLNYFSTSNLLSMVGTDKKGIISENGYVYYLGEETFDGNPLNAAPIVALNKGERETLTDRCGFLNNFTFISIPLDSHSVKLISPDGEEYQIDYDIPVGQQLEALNAKTGSYTIVETSIFGIETKYSGVYVNKSEQSTIEINMLIDGEAKKVTASQDGAVYTCQNGFTLVSAVDVLDDHGLICITYNRKETPIDIADLSSEVFNEAETYSIKAEDRFGRQYAFTIIIE